MQCALIGHAEGRIMAADAKTTTVPAGPTLLITNQPQRTIKAGDTVICFQPGVTQPRGGAVHRLRGLLDTL